MAKPAHQVRRDNVAAEVAKAGGPGAFAERIDYNPDFIRQILNGKGVKSGRNLGDRGARDLEKAMGKEPNWLDVDRSPDAGKDATQRIGGDVIALQIAMQSLLEALVSRVPGSATAFLSDLNQSLAARKFPAEAGELLTLVGIAQSAQEAEEAAARIRQQPGSGARRKL